MAERASPESSMSAAPPSPAGSDEVRLLSTDTRLDPPHRLEGPNDELLRGAHEVTTGDDLNAGEDKHVDDTHREPADETDIDDVELLRNQARQLGLLLRTKQEQLDRREAEWQAQLAQHDNERRAAEVWLLRRRAELEEREAGFGEREILQAERERELEETGRRMQEAELAAAARLADAEAAAAQLLAEDKAALAAGQEALELRAQELTTREADLEQMVLRVAVETAAQRHAAAEVEARRTELQTEIEELRRQNAEWQSRREEWERLAGRPSDFQRTLQAELDERRKALDGREAEIAAQETCLKHAMLEWERLRAELEEERERLAAQQRHDRLELAELRRRAETETTERRQALERQSEQLDFRRAAIRKEQGELAAAQRETLEMRLASEELWTRISGSLPSAAVSEQMARIRGKLSEQYRLLQTDLAAQKTELDALRTDLAAEGERLRFQTQELHRWAEARHEEIERQAAFLTGREAELERQDGALFQRSQAWRQERFQMEQEIRRLQTDLRRAAAA